MSDIRSTRERVLGGTKLGNGPPSRKKGSAAAASDIRSSRRSSKTCRFRFCLVVAIFACQRSTAAPRRIIHGERDGAVPVWQGDAVFVGLKRLGKEVEYRRNPRRAHRLRKVFTKLGTSSRRRLRDALRDVAPAACSL
jgi:hypothetical protein